MVSKRVRLTPTPKIFYITNLVLMWSETKVLDSLPGVLRSSQKKGVTTSRCSQRQLIQRESLSTSRKDSSTSGGRESQGRYAQLREGQQAVIVGDSSNNDDCLVVRLLRCVGDDPGK